MLWNSKACMELEMFESSYLTTSMFSFAPYLHKSYLRRHPKPFLKCELYEQISSLRFRVSFSSQAVTLQNNRETNPNELLLKKFSIFLQVLVNSFWNLQKNIYIYFSFNAAWWCLSILFIKQESFSK